MREDGLIHPLLTRSLARSLTHTHIHTRTLTLFSSSPLLFLTAINIHSPRLLAFVCVPDGAGGGGGGGQSFAARLGERARARVGAGSPRVRRPRPSLPIPRISPPVSCERPFLPSAPHPLPPSSPAKQAPRPHLVFGSLISEQRKEPGEGERERRDGEEWGGRERRGKSLRAEGGAGRVMGRWQQRPPGFEVMGERRRGRGGGQGREGARAPINNPAAQNERKGREGRRSQP